MAHASLPSRSAKEKESFPFHLSINFGLRTHPLRILMIGARGACAAASDYDSDDETRLI